ncbi:MAG: D-sedoheptulose 7-phosphate isomerase [Myxococcota bacterium]|jgi:D-sedoheptulose 7-phosphate isomerase
MTETADRVQRAFAKSVEVKQATALECADAIGAVAERLVACFAAGGKVLLFGNGGSAADAQHIASEFVGRYVSDRPALPAIALTSNSSEYTAIGNDYGFEHVFVRGVEAHGRQGDVAIGISTSGDSSNVLHAIAVAKEHGLVTVGLLGKSGGKLATAVDYAVTVPSDQTPRIQEAHITIGHIWCELVEAELFPEVAQS